MSDKHIELKKGMKIWWKEVNGETVHCEYVIQLSPLGAAVQVHPLLGQAAPTAGKWYARSEMNILDFKKEEA